VRRSRIDLSTSHSVILQLQNFQVFVMFWYTFNCLSSGVQHVQNESVSLDIIFHHRFYLTRFIVIFPTASSDSYELFSEKEDIETCRKDKDHIMRDSSTSLRETTNHDNVRSYNCCSLTESHTINSMETLLLKLYSFQLWYIFIIL